MDPILYSLETGAAPAELVEALAPPGEHQQPVREAA